MFKSVYFFKSERELKFGASNEEATVVFAYLVASWFEALINSPQWPATPDVQEAMQELSTDLFASLFSPKLPVVMAPGAFFSRVVDLEKNIIQWSGDWKSRYKIIRNFDKVQTKIKGYHSAGKMVLQFLDAQSGHLSLINYNMARAYLNRVSEVASALNTLGLPAAKNTYELLEFLGSRTDADGNIFIQR